MSGNTRLHIHNDKSGDAAELRLEGKRTSSNDTGQLLFANNGNVVARIDAVSAADDGALRFFTSATGTGQNVVQAMSISTAGVGTFVSDLVVNGKLGINENSLSSNARLQVRYDNPQSYNAYNALTNPSMVIKNLTAGASKFTSLGFYTESNGEGAISLVQGSGNINADMTFSVRSSGTRAEHMRITHDGNVGIGTTSPNGTGFDGNATVLSVNGYYRGIIELGSNNNVIGDMIGGIEFRNTTVTEGYIRVYRDSSGDSEMRLAAHHFNFTSGNVGINNDDPDYRLDFGVGDTIRLRHTAAGTAIRVGASDYDVNLIRFDGASGITDSGYYGGALRYMGSRSSNNNSLSIFMDNSTGTEVEAMTILQNGKVGIGQPSPAETLHIGSGQANTIRIHNAASGDVTSGLNITRGDDLGMQLYDNPADDTTTLNASGNFNIRTDNTSYRVFVKDNGSVAIGSNANAGHSFEVQDKSDGYSMFWTGRSSSGEGRGLTTSYGLMGVNSTQYDNDGAAYPIAGIGAAADNSASEAVDFWYGSTQSEWQPMVFFCIGAHTAGGQTGQTAGWALIRATHYNNGISTSILDSGGGGTWTISVQGTFGADRANTSRVRITYSGSQTRTVISVWGANYAGFYGAQRA